MAYIEITEKMKQAAEAVLAAGDSTEVALRAAFAAGEISTEPAETTQWVTLWFRNMAGDLEARRVQVDGLMTMIGPGELTDVVGIQVGRG